MGESQPAAETPEKEPRWVIIQTFADDESMRAAVQGSGFAKEAETAIQIVADAERRASDKTEG
jgi:hypothetical protein